MMRRDFVAVCVATLTRFACTADEPQIGGGREAPVGALEKLPLPEPIAFDAGGKKGWRIAIPGARPLATPAVADGILYLGGGFGSHEFYAIDAKTGKLVWGYKTGDDGPTAAVVEDGVVAYNTESCTIYAHDAKSGKLLWSKWLGDPLMSQPAIYQGRIYMAYPSADGEHHLGCMDLKTGKNIWDQKITGDIISAPVASGDNVYCACADGSVFKFSAADGRKHWQEMRRATSAPYIEGDKVYVSQAQEAPVAKGGGDAAPSLKTEGLFAFQSTDAKTETLSNAAPISAPFLHDQQSLKLKAQEVSQVADELEKKHASASGEQREEITKQRQAMEQLAKGIKKATAAAAAEHASEKQQDASVAFAIAPETAKLQQAQGNLGKDSVCGMWSYQGSRALVRDNNTYMVQGNLYRCISNVTGKVVWEHALAENDASTRPATPPSEAGGQHFLGTIDGEILCRDGATGKEIWKSKVGGRIDFQPAVMNGCVYVGTQDGQLICIDTGDPKATGWAMWGANAAHTGRTK